MNNTKEQDWSLAVVMFFFLFPALYAVGDTFHLGCPCTMTVALEGDNTLRVL